MKLIVDSINGLNFRQVVYLLIGVYLLVTGVLQKNSAVGLLSLLVFYQAFFSSCGFGSCALLKRNHSARQ